MASRTKLGRFASFARLCPSSFTDTIPLGATALDHASSRRDFLRLAGTAAATAATVGSSLTSPTSLLASATRLALSAHPAMQAAAATTRQILVPAGAHPALNSAAKILARKLKLDDSAIQTYDGAAGI